MGFSKRLAAPAALLVVLILTACTRGRATPPVSQAPPAAPPISEAKPAPVPPSGQAAPATPEEVDLAVRKLLQTYLSALAAGDYAAAAACWSPLSSAAPPSAATLAGVSGFHFLSSELIDSTPNSAYVQLNLELKVAPSASTGYQDGRNTWFVRLARSEGTWKITGIALRPSR